MDDVYHAAIHFVHISSGFYATEMTDPSVHSYLWLIEFFGYICRFNIIRPHELLSPTIIDHELVAGKLIAFNKWTKNFVQIITIGCHGIGEIGLRIGRKVSEDQDHGRHASIA